MHESDYALADYKLTPLPLLYLKCNLDSGKTGGNVCTINLSDVWGLNAIEQNRMGRLLMTSWYHFKTEWDNNMMKMLISLADNKTSTNGVPPTHTHSHIHTPRHCFQSKWSQYVCTRCSMMYFKADVKGMDSDWLRVPIGYGWVKMTSVLALSEQSYIFGSWLSLFCALETQK